MSGKPKKDVLRELLKEKDAVSQYLTGKIEITELKKRTQGEATNLQAKEIGVRTQA